VYLVWTTLEPRVIR